MNIKERLGQDLLFFDGAMGTELQKRGLKTGELPEFSGVPFRILSSMQTGRRYLAMYNSNYRRFNSVRLDSIKSVKIGESCAEYDELFEMYLKNENKCFGVSFGRRTDLGHVEPITLTIYADEKNESFIVNRLEREKRCGTVERIDAHTCRFSADVYDPNEIVPWIRTFICRITDLHIGNPLIHARFLKDIEEIEDFTECYFETIGRMNRKVIIDGYHFDTVDKSCLIFISDFFIVLLFRPLCGIIEASDIKSREKKYGLF